MSVQIIIDSASDMTQKEAEKSGLVFLPLRTTIDGTTYYDGVNMTHEEFFERLAASKELPVTSQLTPYDYIQAYEKAFETYDEVLVITLSSKLSGTHQSAVFASKEFDKPIFIVDSENVTAGENVLIQYAVKLQDSGMSGKELKEELDKAKKRVVLLGIADTLEYLQKGGRLSKTAAFAGTMMHIKPILSIVDGVVASVGKAHGAKQGCSGLNKLINEHGGVDYEMPILLGYSGSDDHLLKMYIESSKSIWEGHCETLPIGTVGGTIGTHTGPGAILVAFFANK